MTSTTIPHPADGGGEGLAGISPGTAAGTDGAESLGDAAGKHCAQRPAEHGAAPGEPHGDRMFPWCFIAEGGAA